MHASTLIAFCFVALVARRDMAEQALRGLNAGKVKGRSVKVKRL